MPFVPLSPEESKKYYKQTKVCNSPEHKGPAHYLYPAGKTMKWKCPVCGKETIITGTAITL